MSIFRQSPPPSSTLHGAPRRSAQAPHGGASTFCRLALGCAVAVLLLPGNRHDRAREFDAPDAAAHYAEARRAPSRPMNTAALYEAARARIAGMRRFSTRVARRLPERVSPAAALDAWTNLGPGNIGGRTRVVRFHPTIHSTLFAAGVSGGIWRSDDAGKSWRLIADGLVNIAINSLAIDPGRPETMYAGTGEGYFREEIRGTGLPLRGGGIFVTRDGGGTWLRLASTATPDFYWVNDLELGGSDSRIVYAATRTGVWRSRDEGTTWSRLLETNVRGGCLDLAQRTDGGRDVLFAACGSYEQATVYRLTRADEDAIVEAVLREPGMGRTSVAIAPSDPQIIYALAASNDDGPEGLYRQGLLALYRSARGGDPGSWEARVTNSDPDRLNTLLLTNAAAALVENCGAPAGRSSVINMGWYINVVAVDPRDPDRVWAAGVDWFRSDDGGRTWGLASSITVTPTATTTPVHADQHGIAFHPAYDGESNQTVVIGNDGGVFRTRNARAPTTRGARATCATPLLVEWESLNRGYGVTQFYHGVAFPDGTRYIGGAQDNGTLLGEDGAGGDGWRRVLGGDGGHVAVDPTNPQVLYAESQWANLGKSVDGGQRFTSVTRGLDAPRTDVLGPDANYLFVTPFVLDPGDSQRLWLGGEFIYRTTNGAVQWIKASAALPDGGLLSAIAVASGDGNRVAAGTHKGDILWSTRALQTNSQTVWPSSRPRDGWVTSVAFDPRNADIVYATYGNFGGAHVYRTTDAGATWQVVDGAGDGELPDIPVHSIVIDPDDTLRLYLGTDLGVFVSLDGGARWLVEETGFGPAVTESLSMVRDSSGRKRLFAFSHGRGAWRVDVP
jgi:photosystem II stability/assembly factor-like uncharacterized protein